MMKQTLLVGVALLAAATSASAQQNQPAQQPQLITSRSVAQDSVSTGQNDAVRRDWAQRAIAHFLDGDGPRGTGD